MTPEIPQTWEELQKQGQTAIFVLETVMRVPVPRTIKDAVDGKWMEASAGAARDILGRTTRAEKKEWRKRVIKLSDANQILKDLENKIVNSYVLASASPLRIALDGIILIPKWIVKHIAELTLIMLPLFLTSVEKAGDLFMIEERILEIERRIAYLEKEIAELYTVTPRPPRRAGLPELPPPQRLSDYLPPTADELRAATSFFPADTPAAAAAVAITHSRIFVMRYPGQTRTMKSAAIKFAAMITSTVLTTLFFVGSNSSAGVKNCVALRRLPSVLSSSFSNSSTSVRAVSLTSRKLSTFRFASSAALIFSIVPGGIAAMMSFGVGMVDLS